MFCPGQFFLCSFRINREASSFQYLLCIETPVKLKLLRHEARPARLVARAETRSIVTVEVFIEEYVVAPFRVGLEFLGATVDRPPAALVNVR